MPNKTPIETNERWHVGKEIPIALIFVIVTTASSGIWYASRTDARIAALERDADTNQNLRGDVIQIKEQVRNIDRVLTRVESLLDRRASISQRLKTDKEGVQ